MPTIQEIYTHLSNSNEFVQFFPHIYETDTSKKHKDYWSRILTADLYFLDSLEKNSITKEYTVAALNILDQLDNLFCDKYKIILLSNTSNRINYLPANVDSLYALNTAFIYH